MKAMLLAAGRGERMRPLTDHMPKPLLQAGGKPLIVWHIESLARAGICNLVINHAHLGAQIENTLGDGSSYGVHISYSPEHPSALETAGGIANALPLLGDEPFAVINSDIYCDYDFSRLPQHATALQASNDTAHLVLVDNPAHHPNGDFGLANDRVIAPAIRNPERSGRSFSYGNRTAYPSRVQSAIRNPQSSIRNPQSSILTFSGIGVYRPALFADIVRGSSAPLAPLLRAQIALCRVSGEHYTGSWIDVGTPQRLEELDNLLRATHNTAHV